MVVQHNLTAMNANRMLGITTGQQAKSSEKLSSGYRINRAADDAAGLTISEKMRKQIRGLDQASANAEDGISCVQTAEGALTEVHSMLQRMNELAVQAANGTMSESDRQAVQDEVDQLVTEIDRVSETTKFNEIYLLKGGEGTTTETVTTKEASASVSYKDSITGSKQLKYAPGDDAPTLYATKDGVSTEVTADNYKDFFEVGTVTAGYAITDATAEGSEYVDIEGTVSNTAVAEDVTYTYNGTAWVDGNDNSTLTTDELRAKLGVDSISCSDSNGFANTDTITVTAATVTRTGDIYAADGTTAVTDAEIIAADTNGTADTLVYGAAEGITVKAGYQIYTVAPVETEFGAQLIKATSAQIESNFSIDTDLLKDKDGNVVEADALAAYFDENGVYLGGLYKNATDTDVLTEVGAEQIDDYVTWTREDAETEEVESKNPLIFKLHVGSESAEENKITVQIDAMSANGIGVDVLKETGLMTQEGATSAIDTIADAIAKVSEQRSALGAVQNRLEHTISNLDNVVENTTSAESRIRDTDMAEEMVEYSKNNILAQAGQSMLAQANQSTQGVLSLLQ